jgi:hypothetical protein
VSYISVPVIRGAAPSIDVIDPAVRLFHAISEAPDAVKESVGVDADEPVEAKLKTIVS